MILLINFIDKLYNNTHIYIANTFNWHTTDILFKDTHVYIVDTLE